MQYRHDGKLIGQNIIQILTLRLAEKPVLIVSSRAGFLPKYRRRYEVQVRGENIFAHSCDLPKVTPEQLIRLRSQADAHQQFFMQHAPDYFDGMGLMCICRLDFRTICAAALNLAPWAQGELGMYADKIRRSYKASTLKSLYCCRSSAFRL